MRPVCVRNPISLEKAFTELAWESWPYINQVQNCISQSAVFDPQISQPIALPPISSIFLKSWLVFSQYTKMPTYTYNLESQNTLYYPNQIYSPGMILYPYQQIQTP